MSPKLIFRCCSGNFRIGYFFGILVLKLDQNSQKLVCFFSGNSLDTDFLLFASRSFNYKTIDIQNAL